MRFLLVVAMILLGTAPGSTAEEVKPPHFLRAYVHGHCVLSSDSGAESVRVYVRDLWKIYGWSYSYLFSEDTDRPSSFTIGYGKLWIGHYDLVLQVLGPNRDELLQSVSADAFCAGKLEWGEGKSNHRLSIHSGTFWAEHARAQSDRLLATRAEGSRLERDMVPVSADSVLRFELRHNPDAKNGRMLVSLLEEPYNAEKKTWGATEMKPVEKFEAGFAEPFHAVVIGNDYVFITLSGKAFRFDKPEKGKPRVGVEQKWPAPVIALITDTNAKDSHYAIGRIGKKDGYYIALEKDAKPERIHPWWYRDRERTPDEQAAFFVNRLNWDKAVSVPDPPKKGP